jgi:hypothetical protein
LLVVRFFDQFVFAPKQILTRYSHEREQTVFGLLHRLKATILKDVCDLYFESTQMATSESLSPSGG